METYNLDLHSHTSMFNHLIFTKPNKKAYFIELINNLFGKKGNLVLGIANSNGNTRYSKFLKILDKLPKEFIINKKYKDYFVSIEKNNKKIYFVKTDEIGTEFGHILIVGFKGKVKKQNLKKVIKEAHKQRCTIIANHPLHHIGIAYFLVEKLLGKEDNLSMKKQDLKKYRKDFDAIEINPYFPEDWKNIKKFSKKIKLPVTTSSDAHFLNEFFRSYFTLKEISFENPEEFKKSLKKSLKKNIKLHAKKHLFTAKYKHGFQIIINHFGKKIGLIK